MPRSKIPPTVQNTIPTHRFVESTRGGWAQFPSGKPMQAEASLSVTLMERQACDGCGHLHRTALIQPTRVDKCPCCLADSKGAPLREVSL